MRIFVTGATGAIGGYAVPALVRAGHTVSALARSDAAAEGLRRRGATPVGVSLFDREGLARAFDNHDAVANLASAIPSTTTFAFRRAWRECERVRGEGSAAVVDAALAAGVSRLVQESVAMVYRDGGDNWITEDHPVDNFPIARSNHAAEASARRFAESGGTSAVLRFGVFYGLGAAHSQQILGMARRHIGFAPGRPAAYVSSVHLRDAAEAVVAALDGPGGIFNVVDDEPMTKHEHARACAAAVDRRIWVCGPGRLGLLMGDRLTSLTRSLRVSNRRLRAETAWAPRYPSVREGYAAMAGGQSSD